MRATYTNITPIPSHIPRQLAIEILQSHAEVITLNPLVVEHHPIKAPRDAPSDEYYSTWYEITERIQWVPGAGKMGSGKITFKGCFHDMPWGLQTHIYAPASVDLRNKWQIRGNQAGEPVEARELGTGAPADGLYLREDVQIKCNFTMLAFVKKELRAASKTMVDRFVKKAELLDAGVLHAMFENGKLKTVNPADRSSMMPPPPSPGMPYSPNMSASSPNMRHSQQPQTPSAPSAYARQSQYGQMPDGHGLAIEMPGDSTYHPEKDASNHLQPPNRYSTHSELPVNSPVQNNTRWSAAGSDNQSSTGSIRSRPSSYTHDGALRSPAMSSKNFVAELPTSDVENRSPTDWTATPSQGSYRYNPANYANQDYQDRR